MKLKCEEHNRRVVAVKDQFIHRTGDGSKCASKTARLGKYRTLHPWHLDHNYYPVETADTAGKMLKEIKVRVGPNLHNLGRVFAGIYLNAEAANAAFKTMADQLKKYLPPPAGGNYQFKSSSEYIRSWDNPPTEMRGVTPKYEIVDEVQNLDIDTTPTNKIEEI